MDLMSRVVHGFHIGDSEKVTMDNPHESDNESVNEEPHISDNEFIAPLRKRRKRTLNISTKRHRIRRQRDIDDDLETILDGQTFCKTGIFFPQYVDLCKRYPKSKLSPVKNMPNLKIPSNINLRTLSLANQKLQCVECHLNLSQKAWYEIVNWINDNSEASNEMIYIHKIIPEENYEYPNMCFCSLHCREDRRLRMSATHICKNCGKSGNRSICKMCNSEIKRKKKERKLEIRKIVNECYNTNLDHCDLEQDLDE